MDIESPSIYYLSVTLEGSKPRVWRDILVPSNLTLEDLHYVIQTVMGWGNCHLHQFIAEKVLYSETIDDSDPYELKGGDTDDRNEQQYIISQLLNEEKTTMIYEYDLGDSWIHKIELKKVLPADTEVRRPRCIKGEQACPPEDCGGIWGYADILESLQNTKTSERDKLLTGLDNAFNPNYFDMEAVNKTLKNFFSLSTL
jgi:hypothetical protein